MREIRRRKTAAATDEESVNRVWDIVERVGICMLISRHGHALRGRPLEMRSNRKESVIHFVTNAKSAKVDEILQDSHVALIVFDAKENAFLSISGEASLSMDRTKLAASWRKTDDVWWPGGPNDPNVLLLRIELDLAELWDGPSSKLVGAYEMAKALILREEPNLGENRKKTADMKDRRFHGE